MDIKLGIVAVLNAEGKPIGTGFLAAAQTVLTCAHVVDAAGGADAEISLRFEANQTTYPARVVKLNPADDLDIAVLTLERVPAMARILPLGDSNSASGHRFIAFGFPSVGDLKGLYARGEIMGVVRENADRKYLQISSSAVAPGMSGGPLWDDDQRAVVGMVTSGFNLRAEKRLRDESFATPMDVIFDFYPELKASEFNPYRSLDSFSEADAEFFFGRDELVKKLMEKLGSEPRFLAVLGPSGSGKSSVVQAGLFPKLRKGDVATLPGCEILTMRLGADPFARLDELGLPDARSGMADAVLRWMAEHSDVRRLVLFIDQFEELFTTSPDDVRRAFAESLLGLLESAVDCTVIITMRDDFYTTFNRELELLADWLERGLANVPRSMKPDEFRAIIESPALALGGQLEPGLVEAILDDIREANPGGEKEGRATILPLLEFALTSLWSVRENGVMVRSRYDAIGGVAGSLTKWASDTFYGMSKPQQELARRILTDLVHLGDESRNIPNTRRRLPFADLVRTETEKSDVLDVVNTLAHQRLLVTSSDADGTETVEIIHETLLREWALLRQWLKEDHDFLRWYRPFVERRQRWEENARDPGLLLGGKDLQDALGWLAVSLSRLSTGEVFFIQTSEKTTRKVVRERQNWKFTRQIAIGLAALMLLVFIALDRTWYVFLPIQPARSDLQTVFLNIQMQGSIPGLDIQSLKNSTKDSYIQFVDTNSPDVDGAIMTISLEALPSSGNINLSITLPNTYAYQLDFLPEIRSLGPEEMSVEQATGLIHAASAYSVGKYSVAKEMLQPLNGLSAQILLAQTYLYLDDFESSRITYESVLTRPDADLVKGELHMGLGLAWWRPIMALSNSASQTAELRITNCPQARTEYDSALLLSSNPEWSSIAYVADLYCNEKISTQNFHEDAYSAFGRAYVPLAGHEENLAEIQQNYLRASEKLGVAQMRLALFYAVQSKNKDCKRAISYLVDYRNDSFTAIDLENIRFISRRTRSCFWNQVWLTQK